MPTEWSAKASAFGRVEGRPVVAEFDGGALTSDAGGLLLGAADRRLNLIGGSRDASATSELRGWSSIRSPPSSGSGCSASRSATKT